MLFEIVSTGALGSEGCNEEGNSPDIDSMLPRSMFSVPVGKVVQVMAMYRPANSTWGRRVSLHTWACEVECLYGVAFAEGLLEVYVLVVAAEALVISGDIISHLGLRKGIIYNS